MVESTCCSFRAPRFKSQLPHSTSQSFVTTVLHRDFGGRTTRRIGPIIFEGFKWGLFDNCSPFLHKNLKRTLMANCVCSDRTNWTSLLHCNFKSPSTEELSFLNTNGYENGQESLDRCRDESYFKKGGFVLCGLKIWKKRWQECDGVCQRDECCCSICTSLISLLYNPRPKLMGWGPHIHSGWLFSP